MKIIQETFEDSTENIIIARDAMNLNNTIGKRFAMITPTDIAKMNAELMDDHLYEVIMKKSGYCYGLYYDLDLYIDPTDISAYETKIDQFITTIHAQIKKEFPEKSYNQGDTKVLSGSRSDGDKYKISKHILFPIYLEKPVNIYKLVSYLNTKIQKQIDPEIYNALDMAPYTRGENSTQQLRLLGQTKLGKPNSILKADKVYKIEDTFVSQMNRTNKPIITSDEVAKFDKKTEKSANKKNICTTRTTETVEGKKQTYNWRDICNMNIAIPKKGTASLVKNMDAVDYYRKNGIDNEADIKLYLSVIPNNPDNKQPFKLWMTIGAIIKNMEYKKSVNGYDIFEKWTLQAYPVDELKEVAEKCKTYWDRMKETKYGMLHLINIAKIYEPDIYLKRDFAKRFISQYEFGKTDWTTFKKAKGEPMDIGLYYKKGYAGLITDENVGGGKTNAVIKFLKENKETDVLTILFSNRVLFATEISGRFADALGADAVVNYDENRNEVPSLDKAKVLVISFESLHKYKKAIEKRLRAKDCKLICVYDEFETLHRNICSPTVAKPYETVSQLIAIWEKSAFNIIIDAYMTRNAYEFINKANEITEKTAKDIKRKGNKIPTNLGTKGHMAYIDTANRNDYPKTFNFRWISKSFKENNTMAQSYLSDMEEVLKANPENRIVVFCESLTNVKTIEAFIINNCGILKSQILTNTGHGKKWNTPIQNADDASHFTDKNKMLDKRVWIYNGSILNGISIELLEYTKCYGIVTKYGKNDNNEIGILGNDFLNAIARSRLNNIWEVYIESSEPTAYTYGQYMNDIKNNIDDDIKNIVTKAIDDLKLTRMRTGDDEPDESGCIIQDNIYEDVTRFNGYLQDRAKYGFKYTAGYSGTRNILVYNRLSSNKTIEEVETILWDTYNTWMNKGYLICDWKANEMLRVIKYSNKRSNELNGIYKIDVIEALAHLKGNTINYYDKEQGDSTICTHSAIVAQPDRLNVLADETFSHIIEKYYRRTGDKCNRLLMLIKASPSCQRYIENWVAVIEKKRAINDFNPIHLINMMGVLGIDGLDQLPSELTIEYINENNLYDKSRDIINAYKKSIGCKITPDPTRDKAVAFANYLNKILKETGYSYKKRQKRCAIYKYDLSTVAIKMDINNGGEQLYFGDIFEDIWKVARSGVPYKPIAFIEDVDTTQPKHQFITEILDELINDILYKIEPINEIIPNPIIMGNESDEDDEPPMIPRLREAKIRRKKAKEQLMKDEIQKENAIIQKRYDYYKEEYKNTDDTELLNILLNIINSNYEKLRDVKDAYIGKMYDHITHPLNYNIYKMIKYIIYQENYL